MVKIGMMIGERYEILEKIGTGGMSDVYKAKDHKLNRPVAVKVLKQEFSENENFVSKFRIEAQAAAGLMHPNIVNVYDVGEENGIYYIVMELVEGITLKKYIEKKARLSYKEAVSIAIQVSMGIEAAHNNHIIHRDIKPQNIIISKEGKVKVTDFGIAKAATSNTITSNVMGSVHYTSPEQARGGYSDEKSDIYSLGITMFEMLTGRVPFNGETTVAIAIKHIQEELPSPAEFVPEIPGSVENIVLKCCQKSPDRRYQNIPELVADLKQSLMNPDGDFVEQSDPDMDGGTRMISDSDMAQIKRRTAYQEHGEQEAMRLRSDADSMYETSEEPDDGDDYDYNPGMERVTTLLAVIAGIVICVIVIILAVNVFGNRREPSDDISGVIDTDEPTESPGEAETVEMPYVIEKTVEDARNLLEQMGLVTEVRYEESSTVEVGLVMRASVNAGDEVPKGSTVTLTASAGPEGIDVIDVRGKNYEEAERILQGQGFKVIKIEGYNDSYAAGEVAAQVPAGNSVAPEGTEITLTVSLGPQKVPVPNLMGMTEMDATVKLTELGLQVGNVDYEFNAQYPEDQVFYQSYSYNTQVDPGTAVDFKVSQGPEPAQVTYKYNASIEEPTEQEVGVPGYKYKTNTQVALKLVADDGTVILDYKVTSFPHSVNYTGIKSSGGTLTMTFTVEVPVEPAPDQGEDTAVGGTTTEERTVTRRIEFVQE